jgi:hypothetical protein
MDIALLPLVLLQLKSLSIPHYGSALPLQTFPFGMLSTHRWKDQQQVYELIDYAKIISLMLCTCGYKIQMDEHQQSELHIGYIVDSSIYICTE